MSIVNVYHVGSQENILATIRHGSGLKWSMEANDWLGNGIYFWEDPSWAEWWYAKRWIERGDRGPGSILEAKIETELLLDLGNRNDSETFREEAQLAMSTIQKRRSAPKMIQKNLASALIAKSQTLYRWLCRALASMACACHFFLGHPSPMVATSMPVSIYRFVSGMLRFFRMHDSCHLSLIA